MLTYFPITYKNASVLCQSECACLHKTENMVVFFVKSNENIYPKGRVLCKSTELSLLRKERIGLSLYQPNLPCSFTGFRSMNVRQLTQTEPIQTGRVRVTIHRGRGVTVWYFERLSNLLI